MNPKDAQGFKFISVIFLIDGNRNVLTQRVLKKWSGRLPYPVLSQCSELR